MIGLTDRGVRRTRFAWLRTLRFPLALGAFVVSAACARTSGSFDVVIQTGHASGKPVVRVSGLAEADLRAIESAGWAGPAGRPFVSVRVADAAPEAPSPLSTDLRLVAASISLVIGWICRMVHAPLVL